MVAENTQQGTEAQAAEKDQERKPYTVDERVTLGNALGTVVQFQERAEAAREKFDRLVEAGEYQDVPEELKTQEQSLDELDNKVDKTLNDFYGAYQLANEDTEEIREQRAAELRDLRSSAYRNRADLFPNAWQRNMPSWLGGWSEEELAAAAEKRKAAGYQDMPSAWERYAPEWMGGWSSERVDEVNKALERSGWREKSEVEPAQTESKAPSLWERYAPTWMGGMSSEELSAYDKAHPEPTQAPTQAPEKEDAANKGMSAYDRYAPEWMGGKSGAEVALHDFQQEGNVEVFKNVTVADLRAKGYNEEQIHNMQLMTVRAANRQLGEEAKGNMGLLNRFGRCAEPVRLTEADYAEIGLNRQDINTIAQIAADNQGR